MDWIPQTVELIIRTATKPATPSRYDQDWTPKHYLLVEAKRSEVNLQIIQAMREKRFSDVYPLLEYKNRFVCSSS
jgi:non-homologous end joining protein Ku